MTGFLLMLVLAAPDAGSASLDGGGPTSDDPELVRVVSSLEIGSPDFVATVRAANVVVRGQIISISSHVEVMSGNKSRAFTDYLLSVSSVLKGTLQTTSVTVSVPGGCAGSVCKRIAGGVRFHSGDDAVVFIVPLSSGAGFQLVGWFIAQSGQVQTPSGAFPEQSLLTGVAAAIAGASDAGP